MRKPRKIASATPISENGAEVSLRIVDVDSDVELATRYGLRVPVLTVGGILVCEGVYDAPQVRDALRL